MRSSSIVKEVLKELTTTLSQNSIPRASREAQLLLMHHLNVDELWLITHQSTQVENIKVLETLVERRAKNEPLEYITKIVNFYSQDFYIDKGALIPRPETELFIDEVLKKVQDKNRSMTFVEVGVGSGIISIVLAQHFENATFIAIDISQNALDVALKNIKKFNMQKRIELRLGSLFEPLKENCDYLISNPPYIENGIVLESNLSYEPQNALFGGEVGDEIIKELLDEVLSRKINYFTCEMGYDQKDKISKYLESTHYKALNFYKDYSGYDRGFTIEVES